MVSLRDGKTYDPSADGLSGGSIRSRRTSTATSVQRPSTRRSARLATSTATEQGDDDNFMFHGQETATPARGKRQRPQQLSVAAEPSSAADDDTHDLETLDTSTTDQGLQLQEAAATDLPADEHSPSAPPSAKKPRIPVFRTPTPSKAAAAATKLRKEALTVSLAAAFMVLVAAIATAALLPSMAPHRAQAKAALLQAAAHTNQVYLQPLKANAAVHLDTGRVHLSAAALSAQQWMHARLLQVDAKWPGLVPPTLLQRLSPGLSAAELAWPVDTLRSVLPDTADWSEYAGDIALLMQTPAAERSHKAPALILACSSAEECQLAATTLSTLPPKGAACSLNVHAGSLEASEEGAPSQPAAALQAVLAPFLRSCPSGLVMISGAQGLPAAAVPALHNALSELGGFQDNGKVPSGGAAFVLLLQLEQEKVAAASAADSALAESTIRDTFINMLAAQLVADRSVEGTEQPAHVAALQRAVTTLHRRIEFAAPVRLSTDSPAAVE